MGTNYNPKIVTDGISLFFDPANLKSYAGSGTTIFDLSGNGNHGVLSGSPVFENGYMIYDGVDDHITVTSNQTSLDFSSELTVMIWMYHTYTSGRKNPYNQAYGGYGTWTHEEGVFIHHFYGTNGGSGFPWTVRASDTTGRGVWNCMVTTRDTSTARWYKNGLLINSASNPYGNTAVTTAPVYFGTGYAGRWVGNMGPMILYKRALSDVEVQQNFNALKGRYAA
jgi:hypothetical protein